MLAPPLQQRRPAARPSIQSATLAAPTGGLNTVDAGPSMPPTDAILLYNMIAAEYGLRTRLGYREWVTGMTGSDFAGVKTVIPFSGSTLSANKLFAATDTGIWGCTASSASPTKLLSFSSTAGTAGVGNSSVFVNLNGDHFLIYCDEKNGYLTYTETTNTWAAVAQQSTVAWAISTAYSSATPSRVFANGASYKCTTSGTSAASGTGPSGTGTGIADGTAQWAYEPSVSGVDPTTLVFATIWANRVWFVQRGTSNAWYTAVGALYGPLTRFPFGSRFRAGGSLRGLYNWTIDGGSGVTNSLVALSDGGDVEIYQGTDPSQASSFSIKGVWSLGGGALPAGRRIATDFGGDQLMISSLGVVSLSKLTQGDPVFDRSQYETRKIANVFNQAVQSIPSTAGTTTPEMEIRLHPADNSLIINVPDANGSSYQLAMSLSSKGWSLYRDLPTLWSMEAWQGQMYMGTADGRLLINTGYIDGVTLAAPTISTPIQFEVLTSFQNADSQNYKIVQSVRPQFVSQGGAPVFSANARYDYDFSELPAVTNTTPPMGNTWDSGKWDTATWSGDYAPSKQVMGSFGCGIAVAIIIRGTATSRTSLVGMDIFYTAGGLL